MIRVQLAYPLFAGLILLLSAHPRAAEGCCPAGPSGKPVVNADQSIIIIWDAATKTQHFIRRASFKSEGDDFGFLIPSPSRPELAESGNESFPYLQKITEPEVLEKKRPRGSGCGCGEEKKSTDSYGTKSESPDSVRVLEEKLIAGFNAKVLEADTTDVLVQWLKENGYAYSPEVAAWAKPYVDGKWKITALKVAKKDSKSKDLTATALRMSFKTDRPLFPYREPDPTTSAPGLGASRRLLRIYFIGEARYQGEMEQHQWTGKAVWAGQLNQEQRLKVLELLKLPNTTSPAEWWMTEFEDNWPYKVAPSDVYFTRSNDQQPIKREPIINYVQGKQAPDAMPFVFAVAIAASFFVTRLRSWRSR